MEIFQLERGETAADVSLENGLAATPTRKEELYGTYKKIFLVVLDRLFLLSFRDGVLVWGENSVFLLVTYTCK